MLSHYLWQLFPAHFARHRKRTFPAFPLNGRVPPLSRGRVTRDFQAMNPGLPPNCVATEPSTIRDAIRVHATLDPHGPRLSAPNALP